jgi:hypothetical protein
MNVWTERFVLLLPMAASTGLFWWRFRKVLAVIRGSRPTPDFQLKPMGWRIRQFLWEVLLQVVTQSPPKLLDIAQITAASSPNETAVK